MMRHTHTCSRCKEARECPAPHMCLITGPVICLPCIEIDEGVEDTHVVG